MQEVTIWIEFSFRVKITLILLNYKLKIITINIIEPHLNKAKNQLKIQRQWLDKVLEVEFSMNQWTKIDLKWWLILKLTNKLLALIRKTISYRDSSNYLPKDSTCPESHPLKLLVIIIYRELFYKGFQNIPHLWKQAIARIEEETHLFLENNKICEYLKIIRIKWYLSNLFHQ